MSQRNRLNTRRTAGGACLVMIAALGIATATEPANQPPEPEEKATDPQPAPASVTEHVTVEARKDDLTGIASSAADGATGAEDLSRRPILRSGEIVETVPGSVATQHSGGGKANQYFLRGFNLDHGTDLRISVDGMQVNLPTHGHGQGYADLNFPIPELIDSVRFSKGAYDATGGDFASAGSADIRLVDSLSRPSLRLSLGGDAYQRALAAGSFDLSGGTLVAGVEYHHYDGPWTRPDDFAKLNGLVRYSRGDDRRGWSLTALGYDGSWDATDQIPRRAAGTTVDRFGLIDPALGGQSGRYSLSGDLHRAGPRARKHLGAYVQTYDLDLLSNFTYCNDRGDATVCNLDDDQFLQRDERTIAGSRLLFQGKRLLGSRPVQWRAGAEVQFHAIENGLFRSAAGVVRPGLEGIVRTDQVDQLFGGLFADAEVRWTDRLRTVTGLRGDYVDVDVTSNLGINSGTRDAAIPSPRFSAIFGPWEGTELYANFGRGFHSNDARGMVAAVDPVTLDPVIAADPLVRSETADIGVRTTSFDGLQSTLTVFRVELDSELVFVGDAGTTEPGPPSRRVGVELANFYRPRPWVSIDLDLTVTDAEFLGPPEAENHRPGALEETVALGIALGGQTGAFGTLRWRYSGAFPLIEDNSVRGSATSLVNGRFGYAFKNGAKIVLDGFNLLDRNDADIQYYYASRLPAAFSPSGVTEPEGGVEDIHFHPMESRTFRVWLEYAF